MTDTSQGFLFSQVFSQELNFLRPQLIESKVISPTEEESIAVFDVAQEADLVGLALSGGGIRSATFNLGFLQGLAKSRPSSQESVTEDEENAGDGQVGLLPLFDYLSTVSGGGYIGSWFSAWLNREGLDEKTIDDLQQRLSTHPCAPDEEPVDDISCSDLSGFSEPRISGFPPVEHAAIRHLRRFSNYLSPRLGISGDLLAVISLFLRNLVVLQLCLVALVAAVLMVPYVLTGISVTVIHAGAGWTTFGSLLLLTGFVLLIAVMRIWTWQFRDLPKPPREEADLLVWREKLRKKQKNSMLWLGLSTSVLPFVFWLMIAGLTPILIKSYAVNDVVPLIFVPLYAAAYLFTWILSPGPVSPQSGFTNQPKFATGKRVLIALAAAFLFGCLIHLCTVWLSYDGFAAHGERVFVTFIGPPLVLLILSFTIALQLGLGSDLYQEQERERWARVGGVILLAAGVWALVFFIAAYTFPFVSWLGKGGLAVLIGWAGTSGIGAWIGRKVLDSADDSIKQWKAIVLRSLPWFFLAGLAIFVSCGLSMLVYPVSLGYQFGEFKKLPIVPTGLPISVEYSIYPLLFESVSIAKAALLFGVFGFIFLVISWRLDLNAFSAHAIYKNRLVRAYLGASNLRQRNPHPVSGFDPLDDLPLSDLDGQRPLPIINTTINMTGGDDLAWQTRRAASFTFTPTFVGYEAKSSHGIDLGGYRKLTDYAEERQTFYRQGKQTESDPKKSTISLGTAMAISGAAASPNMGRFTSTSLSALLTVFNLRTGYWCGNPRVQRESQTNKHLPELYPSWRRKRPLISTLPLLAELAGSANAESNWVNLSDGGHFENLGVYELIRRRCRFIVVVDAGCDRNHDFTDLANAIRKCWTDFGVHIHFPELDNVRLSTKEKPLASKHGCLGLIRYPDSISTDSSSSKSRGRRHGLILYVKCSLTGYQMKHFADIRQYAETHSTFPHESTSDQFFDEEQFEAYRHLGFSVAQWVRPQIEKLIEKEALCLRPDKVENNIISFLAK